ncbi:MAG TPA: cysteine hydrolase [Acetobacteraceae bacterium]|jgi:ureidoacrylate peracid hydrolase|nr:cysteine hydrolase [Acetobacteraceae bacterium]
MNWFEVSEDVIDRVVARRGTPHCYDDIDPARTALIVVDLQNGFMDEAVGHAVCPMARDIVPNVNRLASAVRASGGAVFWVRNTYDDGWLTLAGMVTEAARKRRIASMSEGTKGHELWPLLDVQPDDETVRKYRFSAFLPGASDLPDRLRARGFDTVLITGTVTNVCCESSARDAMMTNFKTIMVSDANAAANMEEHNASLRAFYLTFGDVMDTEYVIGRLTRVVAKAA